MKTNKLLHWNYLDTEVFDGYQAKSGNKPDFLRIPAVTSCGTMASVKLGPFKTSNGHEVLYVGVKNCITFP